MNDSNAVLLKSSEADNEPIYVLPLNQPVIIVPEWTSLVKAEKLFGLPRDTLMPLIKHGKLPFRLKGIRYLVNIEIVREFLKEEDRRNAEKVAELNAKDFTGRKCHTQEIKKKPSTIRRVEV